MSKEAATDNGLSRRDAKQASERQALSSRVVYEVIRQQGIEELNRPTVSLWWSGVAAGIAISSSLFTQAFLHAAFEGHPARYAISCLGYPVGFLAVILGRLQLFTENTLTAVLPLFLKPSGARLMGVLRLWAIVFAANILGTLIAATLTPWLGLIPPAMVESAISVAQHAADKPFTVMFWHGIPAGFLIAMTAWCLPAAQSASFFVIFTFTYVIAVGDLTHVVAGSAKLFLLLAQGEISWLQAMGGGILPTFLGNVVGGTGLFALLAYAQVREEFDAKS